MKKIGGEKDKGKRKKERKKDEYSPENKKKSARRGVGQGR